MPSGYKTTQEDFLKKATEVHGDRYDYSKVVFKAMKKKVEIICKLHGSFFQKPDNHIGLKQGCERCGSSSQGESLSSTTEHIVEKFIEVHGDKYDYSKVVYKNTHEEVEIICDLHGSFFQRPEYHLYQKAGCQKCNIAGTSYSDEQEKLKRIQESMGYKTAKGKVLVESLEGCMNRESYITYRSSWELDAFNKLNKMFLMKAIKGWASESSVFLYTSPIDGKEHRYFMDLTIIKNDGNVLFVEIKPYNQTIPPYRSKKTKDDVYARAMATWRVNKAKWDAVEQWCKQNTSKNRKYSFVKWTEHELNK